MWVVNRSPELYHYGRKGMRWGVINEEKTSPKQQASSKQEPSPESKKNKGLTDRQKKVLIVGASAAAAALVIYGGYKLHKSGKLGKLSEIGKKALDSSFDEATGFKKINNWDEVTSSRARHEYAALRINDAFLNNLNPGRNSNCGNCTIALELHQRGLDVMARENSKGMRLESLGEFFTGMTEKSVVSFKPDEGMLSAKDAMSQGVSATIKRGEEVQKRIASKILESYPEGSRGNIFIPLHHSNHFTSWFVEGGSVRFIDPQKPNIDLTQVYGTLDSNTYGGKLYGGVRLTRLDDLGVNVDTIRKVVQSTVIDQKDRLSDVYDSNVIQGANFIMKGD